MSITSEISRLSSAKADLKTAIQAKGVTVPTNAKLDDYDTYVGQITTPNLQSRTVSPSTSQQTITPASGYNGLSSVTVNAATLQSKSATSNGTVTADSGYYGLSSVTVNVSGSSMPTPTVGWNPVVANYNLKGYGGTISSNQSVMSITVPVAGTYTISWLMRRGSGSITTALYTGSTRVGNAVSLTGTYIFIASKTVECNAGQEITLTIIQSSGGTTEETANYTGLLMASVANNGTGGSSATGGSTTMDLY